MVSVGPPPAVWFVDTGPGAVGSGNAVLVDGSGSGLGEGVDRDGVGVAARVGVRVLDGAVVAVRAVVAGAGAAGASLGPCA